jgi:hypothetical protein
VQHGLFIHFFVIVNLKPDMRHRIGKTLNVSSKRKNMIDHMFMAFVTYLFVFVAFPFAITVQVA